jgi:hypothetical protein
MPSADRSCRCIAAVGEDSVKDIIPATPVAVKTVSPFWWFGMYQFFHILTAFHREATILGVISELILN